MPAPSPEQVRRQVDDTRAQAASFEQKQAEWEEQHRELQQLKAHKEEFSAQLDDLGMRIHNVARRLAREIKSMEQERAELHHVYETLAEHLKVLSTLDPTDWSASVLEKQLLTGLAKLDRAENDLNEAYQLGARLRHSEVFSVPPIEAKQWTLTVMQLKDEIKRGFFFHLPLCIILSIMLLLWYVMS